MKGNQLLYPSIDETPSIFVNVINARTGRKELLQMLIDTGASRTCFPAKLATFLGHDNSVPGVELTSVNGIGGESPAYTSIPCASR